MFKVKAFTAFLFIFFVIFFIAGCSKNNSKDLLVTPPATDGKVITNVVYGHNTDWKGNPQDLALDIYFPPNLEAGKKYPLVMQMHAGSFYEGDKDNLAGKCQILADSGFIVATINYRVGWNYGGNCSGDTASLKRAVYRTLQDANAAMRFLVSKADDYSIDTNWIFEAGVSAGSVMALDTHYINDAIAESSDPGVVEALGGLNNSSNSLTNTYSIKGIVSIAGALPDSSLINSTTAIPTIFFQGDSDQIIPVNIGTYFWCPNYNKLYGSLCLYRQLAANNTLAIAHILHGGRHENSETTGYNDEFTMANAACFFHQLIQRQKQASKIYYDYEYSCQ